MSSIVQEGKPLDSSNTTHSPPSAPSSTSSTMAVAPAAEPLDLAPGGPDRRARSAASAAARCRSSRPSRRNISYLPRPALVRICETTEISPAQIEGVATFYSQFRRMPVGRHLVSVCHGTACHVAGAEKVTEAVRRHLRLEGEADTDSAKLFTVQKVACLGCCSLAPVVRIDDRVYGHVAGETAGRVAGEVPARRKRSARARRPRPQRRPSAQAARRRRARSRSASGSAPAAWPAAAPR